jgi:hypothetical protein
MEPRQAHDAGVQNDTLLTARYAKDIALANSDINYNFNHNIHRHTGRRPKSTGLGQPFAHTN